MEGRIGECKPAASVLGVGINSVSCSKCPFPFCVVEEVKAVRLGLRRHLARVMYGLGNSIGEIADAMKVTTRSAQRYTSIYRNYRNTSCVQCSLVQSQYIMCKSDIYSVLNKDGQYTVVLNRHRHATARELKIVKYFTEYVFPNSVARRMNGSHDYWVLSEVELEDATKFQKMCDAMNNYALSLVRGERCLQT